MNKGLIKGKRDRYDEYYTLYETVAKEMQWYELENKKIFMNADSKDSAFYRYFKDMGNDVIATSLNNERVSFIKGAEKIQEIPDGRFQKTTRYLNWCDVVITNPPFSLFREYMNVLLQSGVDFIIIAPLASLAYKEIFPHFKSGRIRAGCTYPREYAMPSGESKKFGNHIWITTLPCKCKKNIEYKDGGEIRYPSNFDGIEVKYLKHIPITDKLIAVPETILTKLPQDDIELLGLDREFTSDRGRLLIDGKRLYSRIIIRRIDNV